MSEKAAIDLAVKTANKTRKTLYVKRNSEGKGYIVSSIPGTFCCLRVVPAGCTS